MIQQDIPDQAQIKNGNGYDQEPNLFFKAFINNHKRGRILLPAEGEGKNAVYAASKGWQVDAFDFDPEARERALARAAEKGVRINYFTTRFEDFRVDQVYDAVGLLYVQLPETIRKNFHQQVYRSLRSCGYIILEALAKEQPSFSSYATAEGYRLYDAISICRDFQYMHMVSCRQKETGTGGRPDHSSVLQVIGQKI